MRRVLFASALLLALLAGACSSLGLGNDDSSQPAESGASCDLPRRVPLSDEAREAVFSFTRQIRVEATFYLDEEDFAGISKDVFQHQTGEDFPDIINSKFDEKTQLYAITAPPHFYSGIVTSDYVFTSINVLNPGLNPPLLTAIPIGKLYQDPARRNRIKLRITLLPDPNRDASIYSYPYAVTPAGEELLFEGPLSSQDPTGEGRETTHYVHNTLGFISFRRTIRTGIAADLPSDLPFWKGGNITNKSLDGRAVYYLRSEPCGLSFEGGGITNLGRITTSPGFIPSPVPDWFFMQGSIGDSNIGAPVIMLDLNGKPILLGIIVGRHPQNSDTVFQITDDNPFRGVSFESIVNHTMAQTLDSADEIFGAVP